MRVTPSSLSLPCFVWTFALLLDFIREYLEVEITPSSERIHEIVDSVLSHLNCTLLKLRSVFLVEDIIDSLKVSHRSNSCRQPVINCCFAVRYPILVSHIHRLVVQRSDLGHPGLPGTLLTAQSLRNE